MITHILVNYAAFVMCVKPSETPPFLSRNADMEDRFHKRKKSMKTYLAPLPHHPVFEQRQATPELALRLVEVEMSPRQLKVNPAMVMLQHEDMKWVERMSEHFRRPILMH